MRGIDSLTPVSTIELPAAAEPTGSTAQRMPIVVTGHVDHGKSTIIGRLLADTGSLPLGKLEAVRANCERNAKPFEYAFLLDALKDEQAQGITIDSARVFFKTARRPYMILDAPGHSEFLKNMVTGASRADAALLVIDAHEGVRENSRRHGYLLSMLGIRQIVVLVNKMDLVDHSERRFDDLVREYGDFLRQLEVEPTAYIPVSGFRGDNVVERSTAMAWYGGPTVLTALDALETAHPAVDQPFRMPVQGIYKFTQQNDDRRIIAGSIDSGRIEVGAEIVFYPSGKKTRVRSLEAFARTAGTVAAAGQATGFTLEEQIYVVRGEIATRSDEPPPVVSTRLRVNLFWLGRAPLSIGKDYWLKLGAARVPMRVEQIHRVIDASELVAAAEDRDRVDRHEVAECTLSLGRPLAFDPAHALAGTSRFVIVDDYEISGGGIIRDGLRDEQAWIRGKVLERNRKWSAGGVGPERRAERFSQQAALMLITGERGADRKGLARELEARLFDDGRFVYMITIGNVLYGVDADLDRTDANRAEHVRRLGEVANLLLDAGLIVIATAIGLTQAELELLRTAVGADRVSAAWVGDRISSDMIADLVLTRAEASDEGVGRLKGLLQKKGVIFKPW